MNRKKTHLIQGERPFKIVTYGALALIVSFFVIILISLAAYTDTRTLFSVLVSREILFAVRLTIFTATAATILAMIIAIPAAYAISHAKFPGKDVVDTILDVPIVLSPVAIGAALLVFFNTSVGSAVENGLMRFVFEVPGIILAQFTVVIALAIRLLKSTFDGIDQRYEQVGRTLGYSKSQVFLRVTLPLAKNGVIAAGVLTWARAIGEFGATVTLAGATKMKTETLPVAIFLNLATAEVEKAVSVIFILVAVAAGALIILRKVTGQRRFE
jgi:molybdate transport system permease protein